jgi:SSS family transporter
MDERASLTQSFWLRTCDIIDIAKVRKLRALSYHARMPRGIALLVLFSMMALAKPAPEILRWSSLPELPRAIAGGFAGEVNGALLIGGGRYLADSAGAKATKTLNDRVFVLTPGGTRWKVRKLDGPRAFAASITSQRGLILIGGIDSSGPSSVVNSIHWDRDHVRVEALPHLPAPVLCGGAAVLDGVVYVAAGQRSATGAPLRELLALRLDQAGAAWEEREPLPGPARASPIVATADGSLYLFGGVGSIAGSGSEPYLRDAWCYRPGVGWRRLPDLPHPLADAPALPYGQSHLLIFGGVNADGSGRDLLAFHTLTQTWARMGTLPERVSGTAAAHWRGQVVIPGGETHANRPSTRVLAATAAESRQSFGILDYLVLALYLSGIGLMGVYLSRRNRNTGDFFLGGKRVPWWAAGLSIYGTQLSSITFMSIPAKAYAADWTYALVNISVLLVAPIIVFFYVPFFHRLRVTTAYEYLEKRFNRAVRLLASTLFLVFQLGRVAVVMFLPAIALAAVSDTDLYTCILVMGGMAIVYTVFGGMQAVIWTDVVQSFVLLGGALLSLYLAVSAAGSDLAGVFSIANNAGKFHAFDWRSDWSAATVWVILIGNGASVLATYTSDQTVVQKYLTTEDEARSARSIWTNALLTIPSTFIFFGMGTALYVYYRAHPGDINPHLPTDAILPWFMVHALPAGIAGLVLAGLFAAAQSTLSSSMHSMATVVMVDFYRPFHADSNEERELRLARVLTFLFGAFGTGLALLLATFDIRSLWDVFLTLLSLLGGSLAGIFTLGIFTKRAHGPAVIAGAMASTALVVAAWTFTDLHFFLYAPLGLLSCVTLGYLASFILPGPRQNLDGLTIHTRGSDGFQFAATSPTLNE